VEEQEALAREADFWFRLNHPHVVQLFGACDVGSPAMLVCEYATNGSLDKYLIVHPDQLRRKLHEAALGVQYLHQRGIVHGDLKCNNVVIGSDVKAKVTDFGLSSGGGSVQISGAVPWLAPECLGGDRVSPTIESDVYSLGMCVIEGMLAVENICSPPIP
jgi:serine/threonine protein kinase